MKKNVLIGLFSLASLFAKADEGMWLLPDLKTQNAATMLELGLEMPIEDIYNESGSSIKDAVVHFGRGCTGEVVSSKGLVFTNHHCGYGAIQKLSSVENDYLTDGYWAKSGAEELACDGLTVTFINQILDVTAFVEAELAKDKKEMEQNFLSTKFLNEVADNFAKQNNIEVTPFTEIELRPFYGGNRYMLFVKTVYKDIRLVGTPPSSIGKYGADSDNWMWPRHTGDFSIFRIYADKDGKPAEYSADNVPYLPKKHLSINLGGIQEDQFTFLMGFPGRNWRYMIADEVQERMETTNYLRHHVRDKRLAALMNEMQKDAAVRIHYASKYAGSANYWKNAIGMNEGLVRLKVIDTKIAQQNQLLAYGREIGNSSYEKAFKEIQTIVKNRRMPKLHREALAECFLTGLDYTKIPSLKTLEEALNLKDKDGVAIAVANLETEAAKYFEEVPYPEVERNVARELIAVYKEIIPESEQIAMIANSNKVYKGDVDKILVALFDQSIFASQSAFDAFIKKPSLKKIQKDPLVLFTKEIKAKMNETKKEMADMDLSYSLAHKTWVDGMMKLRIKNNTPIYPDANSTMRLTYGKVRGYEPKDAMEYRYYTTLEGVMQKEDPNNWEFVVPAKLKELYLTKDYGCYTNEKGEVPVCFIVDTDNTGGNSGSPLMNSKGELLGIGFDRNYEGLTGDIAFRPSSQRAAVVDIRYVLFIIDKFAGASRIIEELTIVD